MKQILLLVLASSMSVSAHTATQASDCRDWKACRQLALEAADRREFDLFHDLAWRAVNLGPRNDPSLLTMLARAQSLSGRPHDALVMLNRLAGMDVITDAATSDDYSGVRALPGWADLEAKLAGKSVTAAPPAPAKAPATREPDRVDTPAKPDPDPPVSTAPAIPVPPSKTPKTTKASEKARGSEVASPRPPEPAVLTFSAAAVPGSVGLAYDAVSGRFIIGDREDRRLFVIGERSGRLSSLAGVDARFNDITAFEIDAQEGDLWVVSSTRSRTSTVHKLQLISGRVLSSIELPAEEGAARFTDVSVTPHAVFVLDSEGRRVYRLAKKGKSLDVAIRLPAPDISSFAPGPEGDAFAAYDAGVIKVDLSTRTLAVVEPRQRVDLNGLTWIRWVRGSLIGIQRSGADAYRLVRIRLDESGRTARSVDLIEDGMRVAGPTSATLVGSTLHYLSRIEGAEQVAIKKVVLK